MSDEDEWIVDPPRRLANARADVELVRQALESVLNTYALPREVNDVLVDARQAIVKARDAL